MITTPGREPESAQAEALVEQHEQNTGVKTGTVVRDQQYGTISLHRRMQRHGVRTHLKTITGAPANPEKFGPQAFICDGKSDRCKFPAGQWLYPHG